MSPAERSVTVAIPTYNRAQVLSECLEDLLRVIGSTDNILVSDNASTDGTQQVLGRLVDSRVTVHRNPTNVGLFGNLNNCLELVKTDFVLFLSDDDRIYSTLLPACCSALVQSDAVAAIASNTYSTQGMAGEVYKSQVNSKLPSGLYLGEELLASLWMGEISFQLCGVVFRTEALRRIGGFSVNHRYAGDLATYLRLFLGARVAFEAEPMCEYCVHPSSESARLGINSKFADVTSLITQVQAVGTARLPPESVRKLKRALERYIAAEYARHSEEVVAAGGRWSDFFLRTAPTFVRAATYALKPANRDLRFFKSSFMPALSRATPLWVKEIGWTTKRLLNSRR